MVEEEDLTVGLRPERLQAACDRFYGRSKRCNDIAEELEAEFIKHGSVLRMADLANHHTRIEDPITADYRGYTVYKCDTWSSGIRAASGATARRRVRRKGNETPLREQHPSRGGSPEAGLC